jgi:acetolactate synthase-1/2/3 large subunit
LANTIGVRGRVSALVEVFPGERNHLQEATMPRLGEVLPAMLADRGYDTVFGIPGVHTVEMYRGLPGAGLRHITPRHEQGAGFMADGFARATGRAAACFIISGPGIANIATAMGQAYGDSIPMLVISSVNRSATLGRGLGQLHEMKDQSAFVEGVAAWSRTVTDVAELAAALDAAGALFASARPRPVHIQIPLEALVVGAGEAPKPVDPPTPPAPEAALVEEAARRLNAAGRVALICGGGAVGLGRAQVTALAEKLGATVWLTSNARGLMNRDHPQYGGGWLFAPATRAAIAGADAVLAIGTEFGSTDYHYYDEGPMETPGLIRVDIDAAQLTRNAAPELGVHADAGAFVKALIPLLESKEVTTAPTPDPAAVERRIARHLPLLSAIWETVPNAIVMGDSTEPAYAGLAAAAPPSPRRWWTGATGYGTLGYALPAAIGAKVAAPGRPVVAIAGDGGVLYSLPELASADEAGAPVVLIVWNNNGYGEIRSYMVERQIEPEGVALSRVDFAALASGFNAGYARPRTLAEFKAALVDAAEAPRATVIEIVEEDWELR